MSRVLVIEDELPMRRALGIGLTAHGYAVDLAESGHKGIELAARDNPDLVILDLGLPDMDGVDVARALRGWSAMPIIVLSARDAEGVKVAALDAGADDYVTKPFGMDELLARMRAALRRAARDGDQGDEPVIETRDFEIDLGAKQVRRGDESVHLTPTEWHLLEVLVRNPGKLVTHYQLLQQVWGPEYRDETHYLRFYISQVRRKLEPDPSRPRYFINEPGMGYRFVLSDC